MTEMSNFDGAVMVLRCSECGDTFSVDDGDPICPSCGGADVGLASEPLL